MRKSLEKCICVNASVSLLEVPWKKGLPPLLLEGVRSLMHPTVRILTRWQIRSRKMPWDGQIWVKTRFSYNWTSNSCYVPGAGKVKMIRTQFLPSKSWVLLKLQATLENNEFPSSSKTTPKWPRNSPNDSGTSIICTSRGLLSVSLRFLEGPLISALSDLGYTHLTHIIHDSRDFSISLVSRDHSDLNWEMAVFLNGYATVRVKCWVLAVSQ